MKLLESILDRIKDWYNFNNVFLSAPQFVWAITQRSCNALLHFVFNVVDVGNEV